MTYEEAKLLAITLYWTATDQHDVDDQQWRALFNVFNKKYWNDIAIGTGSLFALDSPDLVADGSGMFDFSGSAYYLNDLNPGPITNLNSSAGGWTVTNVTTATGFYAPDNSNTAWQMTDTAVAGNHNIGLVSGPQWPSPNGVVTVYAKAGTAGFLALAGDAAGSFAFFNLGTGTLGTVSASVTAKISPMPSPSFTTSLGTTAGASPALSASGWYKCSVTPNTGITFDRITVGMAQADNTPSYLGTGANIYVWTPRKAYRDDMVDPRGIHLPQAVELKFLGRYIHLDYEIPQDRYIYNIAFGQVQVLIPNAWTLMGEKIVLLPRTNGFQTIRITYIPRVSEMILDTQHFLNGYLPQFHQLLVYEAVASMLHDGAGHDLRPVLAPLQDMKQQWKNYLQSRQRQEGRKIRFVPYE